MLPFAQLTEAAGTNQLTPGHVALIGSVVAGAFAVVNNAIALVRNSYERKKGIQDLEQLGPNAPRCIVDQTRIKEIHDYTEAVQTQIAAGLFSCAWKDRDEVRDHLEAMRNLTRELKALAREIRITRNGDDG